MATYFISGHLDLTHEEFVTHYVPQLTQALKEGADFVVGDARGADARAQLWLVCSGAKVRVFHMLEHPRHSAPEFTLVGGFTSDEERDAAMTAASTHDIAWVRSGKRSNSGTARNLKRRQDVQR